MGEAIDAGALRNHAQGGSRTGQFTNFLVGGQTAAARGVVLRATDLDRLGFRTHLDGFGRARADTLPAAEFRAGLIEYLRHRGVAELDGHGPGQLDRLRSRLRVGLRLHGRLLDQPL